MIGIYKITNKVNGKFYIGQSIDIEKRWKKHKVEKRKTIISNAFKKFGIENFEFEVLVECSVEELNKLEMKYIAELDPEYNITAGGGGSKGLKHTEEAIKKMSNATKKQFANKSQDELEEWKEKLSISNLKRWENFSKEEKRNQIRGLTQYNKTKTVSEEAKKKISTIHKGMKASEETKQKMRNAHKKIWENKTPEEKEEQVKALRPYNINKVVSEETKEKLSINNGMNKKVKINGIEFRSMREASRYYGKDKKYFATVLKEKKKNPNWYKEWEIEILDKDD